MKGYGFCAVPYHSVPAMPCDALSPCVAAQALTDDGLIAGSVLCDGLGASSQAPLPQMFGHQQPPVGPWGTHQQGGPRVMGRRPMECVPAGREGGTVWELVLEGSLQQDRGDRKSVV